jgi:hypothetical protein
VQHGSDCCDEVGGDRVGGDRVGGDKVLSRCYCD